MARALPPLTRRPSSEQGRKRGGPGFPKGVVGEMGLGVTKDCDYILNMLSIFELGPKILMTHWLNWIGRCREMVGNLCA